MNRKDRIRKLLQDSFSPSKLKVEDESYKHAGHASAPKEGESHYLVTISASAFQGKSRVASHRLIYSALDSELKCSNPIHALAINITH